MPKNTSNAPRADAGRRYLCDRDRLCAIYMA